MIDEGTGKFIEVTIKYKEFEWAVSVASSDFVDNETTQNANYSHFHLQMKIEGRIFIKYSDFHIPFSRMDIINLESKRHFPDKIKHAFVKGEGMRDLMIDEVIEHILNSPGEGETEESAFNISTMVTADEGTTISGDDLYDIIQEAKRTGVTVASLMHKIPNSSATVRVTPGRGVVEQSPRKGGRKRGG